MVGWLCVWVATRGSSRSLPTCSCSSRERERERENERGLCCHNRERKQGAGISTLGDNQGWLTLELLRTEAAAFLFFFQKEKKRHKTSYDVTTTIKNKLLLLRGVPNCLQCSCYCCCYPSMLIPYPNRIRSLKWSTSAEN